MFSETLLVTEGTLLQLWLLIIVLLAIIPGCREWLEWFELTNRFWRWWSYGLRLV